MNEKLKLTKDDIGKIFLRDADYANGGKVRLLAIHGNYFCRIEDAEGEKSTPYDSMINRLTRIDVIEGEKEKIMKHIKQINLNEGESIQLIAPEGFHFGVQGTELDSGTNLTITQYRDADFERKHPEYPQCVSCRKAIFPARENYLRDENDTPSICEKCYLEKLPWFVKYLKQMR